MSNLPAGALLFDRASIQAVDRAAVEEYGIPGAVLMENAAIGLARAAMDMIGPAAPAAALIVCGSGNNGGDGYALARHLHNRGVRAIVAPVGAPQPGTDAAMNAAIAAKMGLEQLTAAEREGLGELSLVVDAVFGTGLDREVSGAAADWIAWMNARREPVLAVDVPSGLDCDTGVPLGRAVHADRTVTFVGFKRGFLRDSARAFLGEVTVADIGAPIELYRRFAT